MDYESLLDLLKRRRSIRSFRPDSIPDEYIQKIIEAARWAPSGFNLQPWEFVVVREEKLRRSIVEYIGDFFAAVLPMEATRESWQGPKPPPGRTPPVGFAEAPVFIIPISDSRLRVGLPMIHRYSDESWERVTTSSMASAFLYMHLAATALGLGAQWVSGAAQPAVHCRIKHLLGLPAPVKIYDMMALGYPAMEPKPRLVRSREEITHHDACGEKEFRNDDEIKDFIYRVRNP